MKKILSSLTAVIIAIISFAVVQARYGNAAVDCSDVGTSGAVWFVYNGSQPATAASIVNPANYSIATALQLAACGSTVRLCAIPQEDNPNRPELSPELAFETRA